jgi:CDP-diacylglycerol--serine O-phosphatidyltransferase
MSLERRLPEDDDLPRRRIDAVALLPSAATLGNLLGGVFAILFCLLSIRGLFGDVPLREFGPRLSELFPSYLAVGAYLLLLSMLFDALDGRLARLARRTTEFGGQLDSVADIVSFGAAPALLFLTLLLHRTVLPGGEAGPVGRIEWRLGLVGALVYVSCAAIRLARYNVENVRGESGQKKFSGLPVPGAAAGMATLLILHEDLIRSEIPEWAATIRLGFGPILLGLGLLMVSRLDYVHVFNVYVRREQPPSHLIAIVVFFALAWWWAQILLVALAFTYIVSGLVLNIVGGKHAERDSKRQRDESSIDMN